MSYDDVGHWTLVGGECYVVAEDSFGLLVAHDDDLPESSNKDDGETDSECEMKTAKVYGPGLLSIEMPVGGRELCKIVFDVQTRYR